MKTVTVNEDVHADKTDWSVSFDGYNTGDTTQTVLCANKDEAFKLKAILDKKPGVSFETEYQLEQFREIQNEHFAENGEPWGAHPVSKYLAKDMLALINQMEAEIKLHAQFTEDNKGKTVYWKDDTSLYVADGITHEYEQDENWLQTI